MIKELLPIISYTLYLKNNIINYKYEKVIQDYEELLKNLTIPEDILFALVCWIDETILSSNWIDKKSWILNSLQQRYFNTNKGGELFFEEMKKSENKDIYAYFLKLGFKGKYYNDEYFIKELINKYLNSEEITLLFPMGYVKKPMRARKFISLIYNYKTLFLFIFLMIIIFSIIYLNLELEFSKVMR